MNAHPVVGYSNVPDATGDLGQGVGALELTGLSCTFEAYIVLLFAIL